MRESRAKLRLQLTPTINSTPTMPQRSAESNALRTKKTGSTVSIFSRIACSKFTVAKRRPFRPRVLCSRSRSVRIATKTTALLFWSSRAAQLAALRAALRSWAGRQPIFTARNSQTKLANWAHRSKAKELQTCLCSLKAGMRKKKGSRSLRLQSDPPNLRAKPSNQTLKSE